jgi:uncharacterized protein (TIGR03067 family)
MLRRLPGAAAILLLLAAQAAPTDKERLQGDWEFESLEFEGKAVKPDDLPDALKKIKLTFKGERVSNSATGDGNFALDEKVKPKTIDLAAVKDGKFKVLPMLYELDGDKLRLCYPIDPEQKDRPKAFTSANGQVILTLKRVKPQ